LGVLIQEDGLLVVVLMRARRAQLGAMNPDNFAIDPPLLLKDSPKPRRLATFGQARAYINEALRAGRPAPWRELWHRFKTVTAEDEAIEAIGDMRELLATEDFRRRFAPYPCGYSSTAL